VVLLREPVSPLSLAVDVVPNCHNLSTGPAGWADQDRAEALGICFVLVAQRNVLMSAAPDGETNRALNKSHFKECVFWDVTPCGSCKKRRFGGT
jgi:hypothetical protein